MTKADDQFYQTVSNYYDDDADLGFKERASTNALLDKIRGDFRKITVDYPFARALEIGCGPGFDVCWFASQYPDREIIGVDISAKMVALAADHLSELKLSNARVLQSDERQLTTHFSPGHFDLVFVYFGALNTVADLHFAAGQIHRLLKPGGHAVLTFVNKWYLREMAVQAVKLNFGNALARLKREWGGYSLDRHLPSRCYSPTTIKKAFHSFDLIQRKGYSILFPAWYNAHKLKNNPQKAEKLWNLDQKLQSTFMWSKGEYTLFVFRKD